MFPFVDVAFGPGQVHKLAEFLTSDSITAQGFFEFEGFTGHLPMKREREFQAWVQISVGCNCRCSYCIVPSTRGREVSRPAAEIVAEVERVAAEGVKEVTLLGQNVCSYGRDLPKGSKTTFAELLAAIDAIDGVERIRYTSPHPKDIREDVIAAHAELPSVCEHIHLPLQSGSSRILKAMRRTYNRERYLDRVAMIRELVPDCSLTTDIIVGFPGETEEDFAETLEVVEHVRYDSAFTFIYLAPPRDRGGRPARPDSSRGGERAHGPAGRGGAAARDRARAAVRGADDGRAGGGPVAHRPVAAARPYATQQDRELHGRRGRGRAHRRGDRVGHQHDACRRGATRWSSEPALSAPRPRRSAAPARRAPGPAPRAAHAR